MTSKGTAYMFVFVKSCPYLPALSTTVQNSWQWLATKLPQAGLSAPYCLLTKGTSIREQNRNAQKNGPKSVPKWPILEHYVPFTERNSDKIPKLSIWEQYVPFTDRNSKQNGPKFSNKWPIWEQTVPFTDGNSEQSGPINIIWGTICSIGRWEFRTKQS